MLPNVIINLANGALGRASASADGVAGLILTGAAEGTMVLNTVYQLSSARDLSNMGVTEENNPLVVKDVTAFYRQAGEGAELHLLVASEATTLLAMCADAEGSPLRKLIESTNGRIRLVGINRIPPAAYTADTAGTGIDDDAVQAGTLAQILAQNFTAEIKPFRVFVPAILWDGETANLFQPRQSSTNRIAYVLASDKKFDAFTSPAIGQVLGRAAGIPVNQSIARVKTGAIQTGAAYLSNGSTVEEKAGLADMLNDAGYIFYRTFVSKNGYYLNDDHAAAPLTDDYSNLNLGRVIDKAIIQAYTAYIDEVNDNISITSDGKIPAELVTYFEQRIENAVAVTMNGEISSFDAYIDPDQNILSSSRMYIACKIVPTAILREITVTLGFENPALKS